MNIVNVTSLFNVGNGLDLPSIKKHLKTTAYVPERFCALIWKNAVPKVSALVFASGKIVVTGGKSVDENRSCALKLFAALSHHSTAKLNFENYSIKNIVMSFRLTPMHSVSCLENLNLVFPFKYEYNPELFLGAYLRVVLPKSPNALIIIFHSGSLIFTGLRSIHDCKQALFCVREINDYLLNISNVSNR